MAVHDTAKLISIPLHRDTLWRGHCVAGKLNRGLSVVHTLATLSSADGSLPSDEGFKAAVVGWCIEWVSEGWEGGRVGER